MDTQQLLDATRQLTADQLRSRLGELDQEARIMRALLRARLRRDHSEAEIVRYSDDGARAAGVVQQ